MTLSLRRNLPSSNSFIRHEVVAITLVSDAQSKIVSSVIASTVGISARLPYALRCTMCPLWPTMSTAPGIRRSLIAKSTASSSAFEPEKVWSVIAASTIRNIEAEVTQAGRVYFALAERLSASRESVMPIAHREQIMSNRKYEAFYIVKPDLADADVQKVADKFKGIVEDKGGTVEQAAKWDKRKLAYEINGLKEGNYVLMHFEADAKVPTELNRLMRISDDVVRHRIFKIEVQAPAE